VEALRKAMGVKQWNLYGVSYGSRYALTIARDFPHSVASMVLDGVVFPNLRYEEKGARISQLAMQRAFGWCQSHEHCSADFPNIEERFWKIAERLNEKPLTLTVTDPETFEQLPVALTGYRLFAVLFHAAYDETNYGRFPAVIKSLEYGNTDLVAPFVRSYLGYLLDPADSDVALATHYCYEEYPFVDNARMLQAARGYRAVIRDPLLLNAATTREWCNAWLGGVASPQREGEAIATDVPTLVLHGALDPVLPVEDIEAQLTGFSNVELLTYPDIAHDVVSSSLCAEAAAGEFYRRGLQAVREASCAQ
jgi:pimeloyl-ACP methyl ester carboxylesterase